jgi:hypothetical protein
LKEQLKIWMVKALQILDLTQMLKMERVDTVERQERRGQPESAQPTASRPRVNTSAVPKSIYTNTSVVHKQSILIIKR